nr:hypothetical protein TetV2_00635 [Oceanusvirus sp.]
MPGIARSMSRSFPRMMAISKVKRAVKMGEYFGEPLRVPCSPDTADLDDVFSEIARQLELDPYEVRENEITLRDIAVYRGLWFGETRIVPGTDWYRKFDMLSPEGKTGVISGLRRVDNSVVWFSWWDTPGDIMIDLDEL